MRFEHLVQINDPLVPQALMPPLTRTQLWRGLVRRAEQPWEFVLGLNGASIHGRSETHDAVQVLARTLDFGSFKVQDHVHLIAQQQTHTHTDAGPTWPASRLTIRIEEPKPEMFYLRFVYEFDEAEAAGELDAQTEALRKQAYKSADLDTVQRIRELAQSGALG